MTRILIQEAASHRLDEIYRYTRDRWGETQAETYLRNLFAAFEKLVTREQLSHPIPAEFGVNGYYFRQGSHFVYWKHLGNGDIGIVTILHQRMHQMARFRDDFPETEL